MKTKRSIYHLSTFRRLRLSHGEIPVRTARKDAVPFLCIRVGDSCLMLTTEVHHAVFHTARCNVFVFFCAPADHHHRGLGLTHPGLPCNASESVAETLPLCEEIG